MQLNTSISYKIKTLQSLSCTEEKNLNLAQKILGVSVWYLGSIPSLSRIPNLLYMQNKSELQQLFTLFK